MRIILIGDTISSPITGIGRYTLSLFKALKALYPEAGLWYRGRVLLLPEITAQIAHHQRTSYLQRGLVWMKNQPAIANLLHRTYLVFMGLTLRWHGKGSVIHGTNYYIPSVRAAKVVTIHDLSVFHWADCHRADRAKRMREVIHWSVSHADVIITHANYNRLELIRQFQLPEESVRAIPLACDAYYHPREPNEICPVIERYGLVLKRYGLCVGTIEPRKNVLMLIQAWSNLPSRWDIPLVLVGGKGWQSESIHEQIDRYSREGWLHYLGYVAEADLPIIYSGAAVFCFPSLYEGFGLPILEAMASGLPVISSPEGSLREVGAEAAIFISPHEPESWTDCLKSLLNDSSWQQRLSDRSLRRAADFSWQLTAEHTAAAYQHAYDQYQQSHK